MCILIYWKCSISPLPPPSCTSSFPSLSICPSFVFLFFILFSYDDDTAVMLYYWKCTTLIENRPKEIKKEKKIGSSDDEKAKRQLFFSSQDSVSALACCCCCCCCFESELKLFFSNLTFVVSRFLWKKSKRKLKAKIWLSNEGKIFVRAPSLFV